MCPTVGTLGSRLWGIWASYSPAAGVLQRLGAGPHKRGAGFPRDVPNSRDARIPAVGYMASYSPAAGVLAEARRRPHKRGGRFPRDVPNSRDARSRLWGIWPPTVCGRVLAEARRRPHKRGAGFPRDVPNSRDARIPAVGVYGLLQSCGRGTGRGSAPAELWGTSPSSPPVPGQLEGKGDGRVRHRLKRAVHHGRDREREAGETGPPCSSRRLCTGAGRLVPGAARQHPCPRT